MADLLDIILGIDVSQIKTAKQEMAELGNSFNSATKSASIFEQAFAKVAAQSARDAAFLRDRVRANQDLINSNLGITNSYKSAGQSASAFAVVLNNIDKVAKATIADFNDRIGITGFFKSAEQSASSFETVLNNIDKQAKSFTAAFNQRVGVTGTRATDSGAGYSALAAQAIKEEANERDRLAQATKREADQLEYLNMKYDRGYAAAKLYKSVQDEINLAMSRGVGNADQLQAQLKKLEAEYVAFGAGTTDIKNRFNQQAAAVEGSRKGVNKWGLLVQQTGYQAGDFLVQLQSGTNVFVAFGQQATQLVGILPNFAAELGVSALALGGITLGLSIAIPLITAIGAAIMRTVGSTKEGSLGISSYSDTLKGLTEEIKKNEEAFLQAKFGTNSQNIASAKQQIIDLSQELKLLNSQLTTNPPESIGAAIGFALALSDLKYRKKSLQEELSLLIAQNQTKTELAAIDKTSATQEQIKLAFIESQKRFSEAMLATQQDIAKGHVIALKNQAEQLSNEKEQSDALTQRYMMEKDIAKFGKDSAEVKKRQREDELALYDKGIDKQVLSGQLEKTAGDVLKIRNRARQDEIDLLQKETDALNNGTKLVRDYLNTYLNLGKVIKDASKVDLKEVFQKAISPSSSLYQFVTKTYDMMLNMANMSIRPKLSFDTSSYSEPKQPFGFGSMGGDQVYTAGVGFESTTGTGKDKTTTGTGGGGGIDKVQSLLDSLKTQTEVVDAWYEESQNTLQSASDKELEIIGGRHEAELRLETEHQQRMAAIKEAVKQNNLSIVLGSGAQILSALGAHNEKAARMAKIFGAAQALADTYVGAAAALKLPFPANLAAAASIISAGLGFVSAIKSGSSSSGSLVAREEAARNASVGGGASSIGTSASTQPATPQTVMIQGIKPTDIFTGEQLSTLFDSLYKENRNRGMVFQVAR